MIIDYKNNIKLESQTLNSIFDKLDEYTTLQENWDGYGCDKPNLKIIENAREFISELMKNIDVIPKPMISSYGNIGFYFHLDNRYIEIEIEEDGYSYFVDTDISGLFGKDDLEINKIDADLISAINLMYKEQNEKNL